MIKISAHDDSIRGVSVLHKSALRRPRLGIFFSHPTQHHSTMFQYLARDKKLELQVYYYDPGLMGGMLDRGYGTNSSWDVDLSSGVRSRMLVNLLRGREVNQFRQFNPGVISAILRQRFDAVMISGYASPSNWLVMAAARLTGAAVYYQSDTNVLDIQRKEPSRWKDILRNIFLRNVDVFLVAGDHNREAYRTFGVDDKRMIWCPIPVDMARYQQARADANLPQKMVELRRRYGIPQHVKVVALCGKLIERKRPQDLIAALRLMDRDDVYGLLIGSGEMEKTLRDNLGAQDQVVITGFVNQSEIPYHMLLADVGVVCSEWDPHPLVTTEFAMCGRPVVVSEYCGVWGDNDILRPGKNGFLYASGDVSELASHISTLLDDDDLRHTMGAQSLRLAEKQSAQYAADVVSGFLADRHHEALALDAA